MDHSSDIFISVDLESDLWFEKFNRDFSNQPIHAI